MQLVRKSARPFVRFSLVLAALACGEDSEGESTAVGAIQPAECTTFSACGGDLTGTWQSQALCVPDDFADRIITGLPAECEGAVVLEDASSNTSLTFGADGSFTETGAATLEWTMSFDQQCISAAAGVNADELIIGLFCDQLGQDLAAGSVANASGVTCEVVDTTCNCAGTQENAVDASGQFTIEGNQVVYVTEGGLRQDFCVQGDRLQVASVEGAGLDAHVVYTRANP